MILHKIIPQPAGGGTYLELFKAAAPLAKWTSLDVAVAYATSGGVSALLKQFSAKGFVHLRGAPSRWIVGVDWFRSQPEALDAISAIKGAKLRIAFGKQVVARKGCTPAVCFHPKAYILGAEKASAVILGSGNLSASGLTKGHEWGALLAVVGNSSPEEVDLIAQIQGTRLWFESLWRSSTPYSTIRTEYKRKYVSPGNLIAPTPTDDDADPSTSNKGRRRAISDSMLKKLRVAKNLWIQAGKITENRGAGKPGNQLMMSPMTRVFFGFLPKDLPRDSVIGQVPVLYRSKHHLESLRFSNNSMEVLTLPIPGSEGPPSYDDQVLLFTRESGGFALKVANPASAKRWEKASAAIGGAVTMTSGRQWGVF